MDENIEVTAIIELSQKVVLPAEINKKCWNVSVLTNRQNSYSTPAASTSLRSKRS
jgi:hypothetical protein